MRRLHASDGHRALEDRAAGETSRGGAGCCVWRVDGGGRRFWSCAQGAVMMRCAAADVGRLEGALARRPPAPSLLIPIFSGTYDSCSRSPGRLQNHSDSWISCAGIVCVLPCRDSPSMSRMSVLYTPRLLAWLPRPVAAGPAECLLACPALPVAVAGSRDRARREKLRRRRQVRPEKLDGSGRRVVSADDRQPLARFVSVTSLRTQTDLFTSAAPTSRIFVSSFSPTTTSTRSSSSVPSCSRLSLSCSPSSVSRVDKNPPPLDSS